LRTYVKIEGKDVEPIVQKLAKLAVDMPDICVWDMNIYDLGWGFPYTEKDNMAAYFGMDQSAFEKHCDSARQRVAKFLGLTFPCNKYPCFV